MSRALAPRRTPAGRPASLRRGPLLAPGMRVGLYGGSFNPPHRGHRHVAEVACRRLGLDRVIWLVTPGNPLKDTGELEALPARLRSVRRLARGRRMIVSDIEAALGSRYTVDTVRWFQARFPGVRFVWIMGSDNLAAFHRWRGWRDLAQEIPIAVVSRPGSAVRSRFAPAARTLAPHRLPLERARALPTTPPPAFVYIPAPFHDLSSTRLRRARLKF